MSMSITSLGLLRNMKHSECGTWKKKSNWARNVRRRRPWKSEWNLFLPQTIQDCHHLRTGFIPLLQASHRPRFRWLLNWCEPYRARSRSSGGSGFDFCPSKMVDFEPILIFWKHPDMLFLFPKAEFLSYSELWGSVLFQWSPPLSGFVIFVPLLVPWAFYKLALEPSWGLWRHSKHLVSVLKSKRCRTYRDHYFLRRYFQHLQGLKFRNTKEMSGQYVVVWIRALQT